MQCVYHKDVISNNIVFGLESSCEASRHWSAASVNGLVEAFGHLISDI